MNHIFKCLMLLALSTMAAYSQLIVKWDSPTGNDSLQVGWLYLSYAPTMDVRFYEMDRVSLRIMSGVFSTTVANTIPLLPSELASSSTLPYLGVYFDFNGDGIYDIVIRRQYGSYTTPVRYGFRVVNPVNGQDIYVFDDINYSYESPNLQDIDNDGFKELIVQRYPYPPSGSGSYEYVVYQTSIPVNAVVESSTRIPNLPQLGQNYPNPFNPTTRISYSLSKASNPRIEILDINGRLVRTFELQSQSAGAHEIQWDGKSESGIPVATGVYLCRLLVEGKDMVRKMIMLK